MRSHLAIFALLALPVLLTPLAAQAKPETPPDAAFSCRTVALETERRYRIPAGLLYAISLVESGRKVKGLPARTAWPWTIHAQGKGYWLDSRDEAVKLVKRLRAKGVKNIDVGCMQVNLMHHPDAFPSIEAAFTPEKNADYAARFLSKLFQETRSWTRASAFYHSRTPARGEAYKKKVLAAWNGRAVPSRNTLQQRVQARTGRNVAASRSLRVSRSTIYIQAGQNRVRIRRY